MSAALERAIAEVERRLEIELKKAVEKYGEDAMLPHGHPNKDIFDYASNELVGLIRYGKMVSARAQLMWKTGVIDKQLALETIYAGEEIASVGRSLAVGLLKVRTIMKDRGLHLGEPERR